MASLVTVNGLTLSSSAAAASLQAAQWAVAFGTADAIQATYQSPNEALTDGLLLAFRATHANATTAPTFSPDGLTAATIVARGGTALNVGDIKIRGEYLLRFNATFTVWELLNPGIG